MRKISKDIATLKTSSGILILNSKRKTGFLGLIICLRNVFQLFKDLKEVGLKYLLTFKLSQHFIECNNVYFYNTYSFVSTETVKRNRTISTGDLDNTFDCGLD